MTCNGWENWKTWNLNVWLRNDYNLYKGIMAEIRECEAAGLSKIIAADTLDDYIHELVENEVERCQDAAGGFIGDFIGTYTDDIAFGHIVYSFLEDYNPAQGVE